MNIVNAFPPLPGTTPEVVLANAVEPNRSDYIVEQCALGTPPHECRHVLTWEEPLVVSYLKDAATRTLSSPVQVVRAYPHMHTMALGATIQVARTNQTLCEVSVANGGLIYGTGDEAGNERGYIVGQRSCTWDAYDAPHLKTGDMLRMTFVYNASRRQTGCMAFWYLHIATPSSSAQSSALAVASSPPEPIRWLHIPKAGSSFVASIYSYACSAPVGEVAALMGGTCGAPCFDVTKSFPPSEFCTHLTEAADDFGDVVAGPFSVDGHKPPVYPRDMGRVVSLFRTPAALKSSYLEYVVQVGTNLSYAPECFGRTARQSLTAFLSENSWGCHGPATETMTNKIADTYMEVLARVNSTADAAGARCQLLDLVVPQIKGGQSRMLRGGSYLKLPGDRHDEESECGASGSLQELVDSSLAFAGDLDRYSESVCAFHLSLTGMH